MPLICKRNPGESWRDTATRYAKKYNMVEEVLDIYDSDVERGIEPCEACWDALCEWDLLEFVTDNPSPDNRVA